MNRIVICDDSKDFRESLASLIETFSNLIVLDTFPTANLMLDRIEGMKPDLILLDIDMPGLSGIEAIPLIKFKSEAKIIMLTVFNDESSLMMCIKNGANGYLLKKTPAQKIVDAIFDTLGGGSSISPAMLQHVLKTFVSPGPILQKYNLTPRELEILYLLSKGFSPRECGDKLFISYETVRSHIKHIFSKMEVKSMQQAIRKFSENF